MIDCDVHNDWANAQVIKPYMDSFFRDYLDRGGLPGRETMPKATCPWVHPEGFVRTDVTPEGDANPGSDYELMREKILDRYDYDYAILTAEEAIWVSTLANPYYAAALAKGYNDWLIDTWLKKDARFKGSLVIAPQDPHAAAAEIRRVGDHPDIVQVLVTSGSPRPYGDPFYHPIWEAASEMGLVIAAHLGGEVGQHHPIACGSPTFFWEAHALLGQTGMAHIASFIAHGVFEKWPNLKFLLIECGVSWLPGILWRLDADYKALCKETPWLRRLPSEYARDHIRLSTQPLEKPDNLDYLWNILEAIDGEHTLVYASDYPHWDYDNPENLHIPRAWRERIFDTNARELYGLPPKQ
ncbi:MAG: amidohydrolase family protein [Chloroflexota bacterium]